MIGVKKRFLRMPDGGGGGGDIIAPPPSFSTQGAKLKRLDLTMQRVSHPKRGNLIEDGVLPWLELMQDALVNTAGGKYRYLYYVQILVLESAKLYFAFSSATMQALQTGSQIIEIKSGADEGSLEGLIKSYLSSKEGADAIIAALNSGSLNETALSAIATAVMKYMGANGVSMTYAPQIKLDKNGLNGLDNTEVAAIAKDE